MLVRCNQSNLQQAGVLCLQNHSGVFQTFVKQLGLLKLNLSSILNKRTLSPDMTIRKIRGKHNHSPTLQLSIFDGSAVLIGR